MGKKYVIILFLLKLYFWQHLGIIHAHELKGNTGNEGISLTITAKESVKVPLLIALVDDADRNTKVQHFAQLLKKACEFTGEMNVAIKKSALPTKKGQLVQLGADGYLLVVYVIYNKKNNSIEWRLYDATEAEMIAGKSHAFEDERITAYRAADALWPAFSGQQGFFSTKIAYCVKADPMTYNGHTYKHIKHIYICDYDGSHCQCVVDRPTLNIGPRWGCNRDYPTLYYSRCTASNMQLIELNDQGNQRIVLNRDGLNMLPSFSHTGNGVAYNSDGNIMTKRFDPDLKKAVYKKITNNDANNVSPNLLDNGDVIFCSDYITKSPQIYYYHAVEDRTEQLTAGGHCCSPAYSLVKNIIAYTKLVGGTAQIFLYDRNEKTHRQITFDPGHKDEPSFSPCGNLLLFSADSGPKSRIVMMHLATKERRYITPVDQHATFASWSGYCNAMPTLSSPSQSEAGSEST